MSITSTITIDHVANTISLVISNPFPIENIVYSFASNSFTFSSESAFHMSASDFLKFTSCLDSFTNTINTIFTTNPYSFLTFQINNIHDINDGVNSLKFQLNKGTDFLYKKNATYPSGNVHFDARVNPITLTYEEWTCYHNISLHYEQEVKRLYNL